MPLCGCHEIIASIQAASRSGGAGRFPIIWDIYGLKRAYVLPKKGILATRETKNMIEVRFGTD